MNHFSSIFICIALLNVYLSASGKTIDLWIHYPVEQLRLATFTAETGDDTIFQVDYSTCFHAAYGSAPYAYEPDCPGGLGVRNQTLLVSMDNYQSKDLWLLKLPLSDYSGKVYMDVFAPQTIVFKPEYLSSSPVPSCMDADVQEMTAEMCQQQGGPMDD